MRGIILAGGTGSRLYPLTKVISKQLLPVYNKPMIYYPLTTLIELGIRDILVITTKHDQMMFQDLLKDGAQWGVKISYATQDAPRGIAEALIIGDDFIGDDDVALILGDNLFHTEHYALETPSVIFVTQVADNSRYGVLCVGSEEGSARIIEKPKDAPADAPAVTGLYVYRNGAHRFARHLTPSARGELEITDLNNILIERHMMTSVALPPSAAWLDTGTIEDLHNASEYVRVVEQRQGIKIGCPETAARAQGFIK